MLIDPDRIRSALDETRFAHCSDFWINQANNLLSERCHGDRNKWLDAIELLPEVNVERIALDSPQVSVFTETPLDTLVMTQLRDQLMQLHPWRKGPFRLFDLALDSEWRSDRKWARIRNNISDLDGRAVLDVGCGNGYYLWRMLGAGAKLAIGIDPTQLFLAQFKALNCYIDTPNAFILPCKAEEFGFPSDDDQTQGFDTVFSMGIYYHRRYPQQHLSELHSLLRPGGELILETLVIEGHDSELVPEKRYAQMRNVWHIPTVDRLLGQLVDCGFSDVRLIDLTPTTVKEQRQTAWMTFDSLDSFLDPSDSAKTIEGYPGPLRASLVATRAN